MISLGVLLWLSLDFFWVLSDVLMELCVEFFDGVNLVSLKSFVKLGELSVEGFDTVLLECLHVVIDVLTEDSISVDSWLVGDLSILSCDVSWES